MSTASILLLGAIAGLTIFLGLPVGRMRNLSPGVRVFLNAAATGVLLFLFWDVLTLAMGNVEPRMTAANDGHASWGPFAGFAALFAGGLIVGLMSLVYYDSWMRRRLRPQGPGAASVSELAPVPVRGLRLHSEPRRLAFLIAVGIGLHNFAEGLAIGQAAASKEISLAVLLIIGFGLHNATEGFGIVGPLAAEAERPSWPFLILLGLIGGGPTFVGTVVGQAWVSDALATVFLTLAAGSILYVVIAMLGVCAKSGRRELMMWGILLGAIVGFATDLVVTAAGA
ncbi:MAG: zinc transporter, family [Frankiales bacterium]|nr:zinc transporter, family [Frankiales bacterium]MDX6212057.1 zinc transporter, family [Frankiales bacterium]